MSDIAELRKILLAAFAEPNDKLEYNGINSTRNTDEVMKLITQYGDKRELEGRIDELHYIPSNFFVVKDGVETRVDDRLAELKKLERRVM